MVDTTFWEKFSFDYRLDVATLFTELIAIEAFRQSVMNLVLSPEWRTQLDKLNRVRAVYGTTALEGNPLSESEVSHQMELIEQEENTLHGTVTREQLQIRNAARAQAWIKKRFAPGNPCESAGLDKETVCAWESPNRAGRHFSHAQNGY